MAYLKEDLVLELDNMSAQSNFFACIRFACFRYAKLFSYVMHNYPRIMHSLTTLSPYYRCLTVVQARFGSDITADDYNIMRHYRRILLCINIQHYCLFCCLMLQIMYNIRRSFWTVIMYKNGKNYA